MRPFYYIREKDVCPLAFSKRPRSFCIVKIDYGTHDMFFIATKNIQILFVEIRISGEFEIDSKFC